MAQLSSQASPNRVRTAAPRAAYIHVPFCARRCGYCNFTLVAGRNDLIEPYLDVVSREMAELGVPHEVDTIYIGGGTPTQLSPKQLDRLLDSVTHWFSPASGVEFSVEANPADVDREIVAVMRRHGVTRISLGVQSFDDTKLATLERDHRAADIRAAVGLLREHDLQISLDLIFAAPSESYSVWQRDLQAALDLEPDHISTYGMTYERGAAFWSQLQRGLLSPIHEELERMMYETAIDTLCAAGFEHYEVSNFARLGCRSRHNEAYWSGAGYYAAGPGAARFVSGVRETNHRSTTNYLRRMLSDRSPVAEREILGAEDAARERLVFGLRRMEGVDGAEFQRRTGFQIEQLGGAALKRFLDAGLLEWAGPRLRLTRAGLMVSDGLWPEFL